MLPAEIRTPRLRLVAAEPGWGPRRVIRAYDDLDCGSLDFAGSPEEADDGVSEIEFRIELHPEARGHGAASEAVAGLAAATDAGAVRLVGAVAPENKAGLRVLAKCGFTGLRGVNGDDELVMVRPLPQVES